MCNQVCFTPLMRMAPAAVLNTQPEFRLQVSTNQTAWPDQLMLAKFLCADLCTDAESDPDVLNRLICHLYSIHPVKCLFRWFLVFLGGLIPLQLCPEWDYLTGDVDPLGNKSDFCCLGSSNLCDSHCSSSGLNCNNKSFFPSDCPFISPLPFLILSLLSGWQVSGGFFSCLTSLWGFARVTKDEWKLLSASICEPGHFHLGAWLFPLHARWEKWIYKYRMEARRNQQESREACELKVCLIVPQMCPVGGYSLFQHISPDTHIVVPYVRNDLCNVSKTVCPTDWILPDKHQTHLCGIITHLFCEVGGLLKDAGSNLIGSKWDFSLVC